MDTIKKHTSSILTGLLLVMGITAFSLSSKAQTSDNSNDKPAGAYHHHDGADSLHRRDGARFHREGNWGDKKEGFRGGGQGGEGGFAGRGPGMRGHGRRGHGMEMAGMHFSPEQRKQMQAINTDFHKKQQDLYKNDKMTLGEYKAKLLALRKDKKSQEQALLTPEQKDKIAQWKKKGAENAQVRAAANLERMKIKLNLSDDQTAKIKDQQNSFRAQLAAIRANESLLPEQKMEQMKGLMAKRQDALKSVLTPEQLSKFGSLHNRHWGERGDHGDHGPSFGPQN